MYKNWSRFVLVYLLLWFIQFNALAQEVSDPSHDASAPTETRAKAREEPTWSFSGLASQEYRFRHSNNLELDEVETAPEVVVADDETDNDVRLFLSGYLWEKSDHFAGDLSMGLWYDLDGISEVGRPSSFASIDDYEAPQSWHDPYDVYSLYGEYHASDLLGLVRGGRQTTEYGRPITFDGATVKLNLIKPYFDWAFFGGRTVHYFEIESGLFDDWLASTAITIRPFRSLRVEMDYRFAAEQYSSGDSVGDDRVNDHSYGMAVWYELNEWARLKGYLRGLNSAASNAGGGARLEWIEGQLGLDGGIDGQLTTFRSFNERDDPYFEVLGESLPHIKIKIDIWKSIATDFGNYGAHFGWQERVVTKDEPDRFNRDFGRLYLLLEANDIGISGPFASLVVEYNKSLSRADVMTNSLFAVGGSAGYKWKPVEATVGSYYYRYKYDYYVDLVELENVRSYFGEVRYDPIEWFSVRLKYIFEQFDRDLHTVTLKLVETY